jgi:hypothetical protein
MKKLRQARKNALVLAAALISTAALSSESFAAIRSNQGEPRNQSGTFNPRVPEQRPGSSIDMLYQAPFYGNG